MNQNLEFEKSFWQENNFLVAGVDEVGRGCLAGDVVTCAVILDPDEKKLAKLAEVTDSKKLSAKKRDYLFEIIKENVKAYSLAKLSNKVIDEINILQATFEAMRLSIKGLNPQPTYVLVDGDKRIPLLQIPQRPIIKGDFHSLSIACASILAKVTRDRDIEALGEIYPNYGFAKHKAYATKDHIEAIKKYGLTDIHRKTFCKNFFTEQIKIDF